MSKENIVTTENPIKRGEQVIEKITLMKPNAGTLRGVSPPTLRALKWMP